MIYFDKVSGNVQSEYRKFVCDCQKLKNYSSMDRNELSRRIASLALSIFAAFTALAGISIFTAGSIVIMTRSNITAIAAVIHLIHRSITTLAAPFIAAAGLISRFAESLICKTASIAGLGTVTYIGTSFAYRKIMKFHDNFEKAPHCSN